MVGFRNQVGTAAITNWVSPQAQQIAFGRGSAGFVAINNADSRQELRRRMYGHRVHRLRREVHCNRAGTQRDCDPYGSAGFAEMATTTFGENIFLVGSVSQLGTWDPAASLPLSSATYPTWTITVNLPPNTSFQYKFIRKETDGSVVWESDPNRSATTNASGSQTISTTWR
ncbi:Alpha-amylase [Mycena venus]|uniref:Alpha-amylase n=1 Tax=Mycena venus TaxID=2733690 RepID=A0A8H6XY88_9AGAR|nr:Alpha-amylase [Mycena venus]